MRKHQYLSLFLSLLLLTNSSFALEIITHDTHQHADQAAPIDHVANAGMHVGHEMMANNHMIIIAEDMQHDGVQQGHQAHGDDDCVCDEICCLSSVGMGMPAQTSSPAPGDLGKPVDLSLYKSISLDLLLPPPTS